MAGAQRVLQNGGYPVVTWVQLGLRLQPAIYRQLKSLARKDDKPLNRYITDVLKVHLESKKK